MKSAVYYSKQQIKELSKLQRQAKRRYLLLSYLVALLNAAVITLAIIAIKLLLGDSNSNVSGNSFKIFMASLAAGTTILIFLFNMFNIIYRGVMKFKIYKNAMDEIEHLIAKHRFAPAKQGFISEKVLVQKTKKVYKNALKSKRNHKMIKSIWKALIGGDNA